MKEAPALTDVCAEDLIEVIRKHAGDGEASLLTWSFEAMPGGVGNPVSAGLHRFRYAAQVNGSRQEGRLVLKMIQSPANLGFVNMGEGDDQQHWNYWLREAAFYQSGLCGRLPTGIAAAKFYGIQKWAGDVVWLWLEEIVGYGISADKLEDLERLASYLGRFNGAFLDQGSLPNEPWLAQGTVRQQMSVLDNFWPGVYSAKDQSMWANQAVQELLPGGEENPWRILWNRREQLLSLIDGLPKTWCHGDAGPTNFMFRAGPQGAEELAAFDWAMCGIDPVGMDAAHTAFVCAQSIEESMWDTALDRIFSAYAEGLAAAGRHVDLKGMRLVFAASLAVKYGSFVLSMVALRQRQAVLGYGGGSDGSGGNANAGSEQEKINGRFIMKAAELALTLAS